VLIEPHLGSIKKLEVSMPHPSGRINVNYRYIGNQLQADVELPPGMSGTFKFQGQNTLLRPGMNELKIGAR
jgi:hypothetical protein